MAELAQKKRARAPHRSVATKKVHEVDRMLVAIGTGGMPNVVKLEGLKATLREKLSYQRQLDTDIEGLIEGEEDLTVKVQKSEDLAQEIHTAIAGIE